MARRLVPFTHRQVNAGAAPQVSPATANVRFTEHIEAQIAPDPPRASDFNTRVSRRQFYHGGTNRSQTILREGFERSTVRVGIPRVVGTPRGRMLPVGNPTGNSPDLKYNTWGGFLDAYTAPTTQTRG
jgi:hypothetical protein